MERRLYMRLLDSLLLQRYRLKNGTAFRLVDIFFFVIITCVAIIARGSLFEYASGDYNSFLSPWFNTLKEAGGISGIGLSLGDYTPPYIYILSLLTYLPIDSLFSIKIISCIFDFICAFTIMRLVYERYHKIIIAFLSYAIILFAPTVLLNSAMWSQCDALFTSFLLLCVCAFLREKPFSATVYFAIAFIFKLQAIFLAPLLILLWLKGKIKFSHFFLIPAIYIISIIPAWIAGRPLGELLTIYLSQSGQYPQMSLNAPSLYSWIDNSFGSFLSNACVFLCGTIVLSVLYYFYQKRFVLTKEVIVAFSLFFVLLIPFLLPHMHERYFFAADIFAILYAFYFPKRFYVAIGVTVASMAGYCPYLFHSQPIPLEYATLLLLVMICIVVKDIYQMIVVSDMKEISV